MDRRHALRVMAGSLLVPIAGQSSCAAQAPVERTSLGIVVYSLGHRRQAERRRGKATDLFEPLRFLDYCYGLGAGGIQVPLGIQSSEQAHRLRSRAERCRMFIEGIVAPPHNRADLDRFEAEVRTASEAGARAVRAVILPGRRYERFTSLEEFRRFDQQGRRRLEMAVPVVEKHRLPLAVENHKGHRVEERVHLFEQISSEYLGACVDTGNNLALLDDPLEVVRALAPWAFAVHLKDQAVAEYRDGFLLADVPLGKGCLDLKAMVTALRAAKPDLRFGLELITRDPLKVPCLREEYWATFPAVPGRDLARTLRMVRRKAADRLPEVSALSEEEQLAMETANIAESFRYAKKELGF